MSLIVQLREEDRVRLLPHQKAMDHVGPLLKVRANALGPMGAFVTLAFSSSESFWKELLVDFQHGIQLIPSVPKRIVGGVPPQHLHVPASKPAAPDASLLLSTVIPVGSEKNKAPYVVVVPEVALTFI